MELFHDGVDEAVDGGAGLRGAMAGRQRREAAELELARATSEGEESGRRRGGAED